MHDQPKYADELKAMGLHQLSLLRPLIDIIDALVIRYPISRKAVVSRQLTFDYADTYDMHNIDAIVKRLTEAVEYQSGYGKEILIVAWLSWTLYQDSEQEQKEIIYTCTVKMMESATYLFKQKYGAVPAYHLDVRPVVPAQKILELIGNVHDTLDLQHHQSTRE